MYFHPFLSPRAFSFLSLLFSIQNSPFPFTTLYSKGFYSTKSSRIKTSFLSDRLLNLFHLLLGFLVDKFGRYKPVVIMTLILNAIFHHALMVIPQQEIPGQMPSAFVMRHPETGKVEVWWSPCPSRECPEEEELAVVVDQCLDHCLLLEQNPKIEIVPPPTNIPFLLPNNKQEVDDLNFQLKKKNIALTSKNRSSSGGGGTTDIYSSSTTESTAFVDGG
jgi:MFS_1 like family